MVHMHDNDTFTIAYGVIMPHEMFMGKKFKRLPIALIIGEP